MDPLEDLCVRVAEIHVKSAPILECSPQAAGHLGNIRLTWFDSGSRQTIVFWIQIATNEASNAFPGFSHMRGLFALCSGAIEPRVLDRSAPAACAAADHASSATHGSWRRVASRAARHTAQPKPARALSARRFRHCAGQDVGPDRLSSRRRFDIRPCPNYRECKRSIPWNLFRWSGPLSLSVQQSDGISSTQPDSRDTGIQRLTREIAPN